MFIGWSSTRFVDKSSLGLWPGELKSAHKVKSGGRYSYVVSPFLKRRIAICISFNANINKMKRATANSLAEKYKDKFRQFFERKKEKTNFKSQNM
jgi:hypothetical protein